MCLVEDIPIGLRTIYHLCGIIQFTCSPNRFTQIISRLLFLPFFLFYGYCCVKWFIYLILIIRTDFMKFEVVMTLWATFTEITSMIVFTLRNRKLKTVLLKLNEIKIKFRFVEKKKLWHDWVKTLTFVTIILQLVLILNVYRTWWSIHLIFAYIFIPPITCLLNNLFLDNVLQAFYIQFRAINSEIQEISRLSDISFDFTKFRDLEELSLLHYNLVRLVLEINSLFDVTILTSMVLWFGNIVSILFIFVESVLKGILPRMRFRLYLLCLLIHYLLWLFIVVRMYSRTQKEANQTSVYVHQIWNQHSEKKYLNEKTRHLQLISCRLFNTKLFFNAKGFFRLDETFFHTMIAAVVTYLIILIQFRI
ncbi:hypothetical protein Zmor_020427 [Zophobas morio]|uniref:Gustatory receptor n=1 Tax=Zophobas morio TaxID=2755281 RepID=A0AA38MA12_9CUCU|nr:hypothetical protein Zmor_020427 [Zophobas morio]